MAKRIRTREVSALIAGAIGFTLEFFLIPEPRDSQVARNLNSVLHSGNFYYALLVPIVIWWWFRRFLRSRAFNDRELVLAFGIFGIYLSSALRSIAVTLFQLLHLTNHV